MKEGPELQVIREVLEGMLSRDVASAVLFEALESEPNRPEDPAGWMRFARGALKKAATRRCGVDTGSEILERISLILGRPSAPLKARRRQSEIPTGRFQTHVGPARVLLVAGTGRLARSLKAALREQVVPLVCGALERLDTFAHDFRPNLVIVDATDPPPGPTGTYAASFGSLHKDVLTLIWDDDGDFGETLQETLSAAGRRVSRFAREDGVDPLLDLVRAMQT
ncbi:MAG: hypothetical protein AAGH15_23280 [Myxococcota bacterium]